MREKQLQRMLGVMRQTGDKAFVMDMESDDVFMMMNLTQYEEMISTPDNPKDSDDDSLHDYVLDDLIETAEKEPKGESVPSSGLLETEKTVIEKSEVVVVEPHLEPLPINKEIAEVSQENEVRLTDVPNDGEEEKFYLEPVE